MKRVQSVLATILAAVLVVAAGLHSASSQQINSPVSIGRGGGTGGVGMSLGHRQAILEEELLNRRPDTLLRDATGALVEVERSRSSQAFVRGQASPFLPGNSARTSSRSMRFVLGVGGIGFGAGTAYVVGQGGGGSAVILPASPTPIDSWIGQLYNGHRNSG